MRIRLAQFALSAVVLFLLVLLVKMGLWQSLLTNPTAQFSYAGILILYLCSQPSRYEAAIVGLAGLFIRIIASNSLRHDNDYWLEPFFRLAGFIGFAGIGALGIRSGFGRSRHHAVAMLLRILIFAVLGVFLRLFIETASQLRPLKLDAYLFAIEQGYGLPYARAIQWSAASPWLMQLELLVYYSLPLGLAVLYAAHLTYPRGKTNILFLLYINAIIGFSLYLVYPACGPIYAFGSLTASALIDIRPIALNCKPNCMPSLHMAGALLMWWNFRWFTYFRMLTGLYVALTAFATMGLGEHYLIDLIVAAPYALLIQALATDAPGRVRAAIIGASFLMSWLALLRFAVSILAGSHSLLWTLSLVTIAVTWSSLRPLFIVAES